MHTSRDKTDSREYCLLASMTFASNRTSHKTSLCALEYYYKCKVSFRVSHYKLHRLFLDLAVYVHTLCCRLQRRL